MRIINRTHYDTRALRSLLCEVHRRLARYEGRLTSWKSLRVEVDYFRATRYIHRYVGKARLGQPGVWHGGWMHLQLPRDPQQMTTLHVAALIEHELLHLYGYRHGHGVSSSWKAVRTGEFDWAALRVGRYLPVKALRVKPKPNRVLQRYLRATQRLRDWGRRAKRAQTEVRKLRKIVRYYEHQYGFGEALAQAADNNGAGLGSDS